MEKVKLGFEDFISTVDANDKEFVNELHKEFIDNGCKIEVKEAKSGYMVSYLLNKKTVANFVFRKAGILIRIYANNIRQYMELLETFPDYMIELIKSAPVCKRLVNPEACNSKCAKGYDFLLQGEHLQKCRNNAFMFLLCKENNPSIKALVQKELTACKS